MNTVSKKPCKSGRYVCVTNMQKVQRMKRTLHVTTSRLLALLSAHPI
jgi:hypothetical protein